MRLGLLGWTAFLLIAGCGDDGTPDDGGIDGGGDAGQDAAADAGLDSWFDAGPPPPELCDPCRRDVDCGPGNLCLVLEGGARACGRACETDEDCSDSALPATCYEEVPGLPRQCRPGAGRCIGTEAGSACDPASGGCFGTYDLCADPEGLGAVCTTRCATDADCPIGLHRCRDTADGRVCVPDELAPARRCEDAAAAAGVEACGAGGSCASGTCMGSGSVSLCLQAPGASGCPDGTVRMAGPGGGEVCVPHLGTLDPSDLTSPDCACVVEDPGSLLDDTAALIDKSRCDMSFSAAIARVVPEISRDPYRLSWTDRLLGHWPGTVTFAEGVTAAFDGAATGARPMATTIATAATVADLPVAVSEPPGDRDLVEALAGFVEAAGGTADRTALATEVGMLDGELATALAPILGALRDAYAQRAAALVRLDGDEERYFEGSVSVLTLRPLELERSADRGALRGDVDVAGMARSAARIAAALDDADLSRFAGRGGDLTVDTPGGRIAVRGGMNSHTYEDAEWHETAFLLDLGGNETYRFPAGANASVQNGVAVVVDVGGADTYAYDEVPNPRDVGPDGHIRLVSDAEGRFDATPGGTIGPISLSTVSRQGAGRLGIGLLIDLGTGNDEYRSHHASQGFGQLGVGMLWDEAGDDVYWGESDVQGAAAFGVGLLVDLDGVDAYRAYSSAQGYGFARAVGALWDGAGDDEYFLHPSDILYYSPQDPDGSNNSSGQGFGHGRRADFTPDGIFMSGGLGYLRDRSGSDRYTAAIFAQGAGFWFGTGMLIDSAGNDTYNAQWYGHAGAAHFSVAVMLDEGGNDIYNMDARRQNVILGGGHDFSIAWFTDRGGDDMYFAPGLSYGTGNDAGAGVFADAGGVDTYDSTSDRSFGNANAPPSDAFRVMSGTFGLFMEADGTDTFTRPMIGPVANDTMWTQETHMGAGEQGAGIDRSGGRLGF